MMTDHTNYKNYSLEQLDNWIHDAMNCDDISSKEIYNVIVGVVESDIEYHQKSLCKSTELLSLLKGNDSVDMNEDDYWKGDCSDEDFNSMLSQHGYEYTPPIPKRY